MIQIYKPDNTNFDKNGDMTLMPSKAIVGRGRQNCRIRSMQAVAGNTLKMRQS